MIINPTRIGCQEGDEVKVIRLDGIYLNEETDIFN